LSAVCCLRLLFAVCFLLCKHFYAT
jgi:hypothetical protein